MELLIGARDKKELQSIISFLSNFKLIEIDHTISKTAIKLIEKFGLSHSLKIPDALIASTALNKKISLYTKNLKDFKYINKLQIL